MILIRPLVQYRPDAVQTRCVGIRAACTVVGKAKQINTWSSGVRAEVGAPPYLGERA